MGKFGHDWQRVSEEVGTRNPRQCNDRYRRQASTQTQHQEKIQKKPQKVAQKQTTVPKPVYTEDTVQIKPGTSSGSIWDSLINSQNKKLSLTSNKPKEASEVSEISEISEQSSEDQIDTEDSDSEPEPVIYKPEYRGVKLRPRKRYSQPKPTTYEPEYRGVKLRPRIRHSQPEPAKYRPEYRVPKLRSRTRHPTNNSISSEDNYL